MTIFQKAIKVRKVCELQKVCANCPYKEHCLNSHILLFDPSLVYLKMITKAIVKEKWIVK